MKLETIYIRWADDGHHIRKWDHKPFEHGIAYSASSEPDIQDEILAEKICEQRGISRRGKTDGFAAYCAVVDAIRMVKASVQSEASGDDVELANVAVEENLNSDGTAKHGTAQGYACAMSAIRLTRYAASSKDGLREAYDAAAHLIECLDAVSRGVPVRNLDEAWERYGNARAALQMGGEKP